MLIGELARAAGVGVETVRFYERKGMIRQPPRPRGGGYRDYPVAFVGRIRFIREAQGLGFSLSEIRELLALEADPGADCSAVQRRALAKRDELDAKIRQIERIRASLTTLIEACPGRGALVLCTILEALGDSGGDDGFGGEARWRGKNEKNEKNEKNGKDG